MNRLNSFTNVTTQAVLDAAAAFGSPLYLYDEALMIQKCHELLAMPHAFGLTVLYAMKANSNRTLLKIVMEQGLHFDASSLNEVRRARLAGVPYESIILTTQEIPLENDRKDLEEMMLQGLKYNVCSLRQLVLIGSFAAANDIALSIRIHPGVGSGETATRNTGDKYTCFGVHLSDVGQALSYAGELHLKFDHVHIHIGSGADPAAWHNNIDLELSIIEKHFPDAVTVSFGGGLREARMPDETAADIQLLGAYAKERIQAFYEKTGRRLHMEIEPGTYLMANAGYAVTRVADKKNTGTDGFRFIVADGGMEINARPLLYASRHPFYIIGKDGSLLSSEFDPAVNNSSYEAVVMGKCCETGDSQTIDKHNVNTARKMAEPAVMDFLVIGGCGAYCSSMSPMNYNSHQQIPEVLFTRDGQLKEIRRRQTLEQMLENEL